VPAAPHLMSLPVTGPASRPHAPHAHAPHPLPKKGLEQIKGVGESATGREKRGGHGKMTGSLGLRPEVPSEAPIRRSDPTRARTPGATMCHLRALETGQALDTQPDSPLKYPRGCCPQLILNLVQHELGL